MNPLLQPSRAPGRLFTAVLTLVSGWTAFAATPEDFGYGRLKELNHVTNQRPVLVILVNFTNAPAPFQGDIASWNDYLFNPTPSSNGVNQYFREVSNGQFMMGHAGTVLLRLDRADTYASTLSRANDDNVLADTLYTSNIVYHAMGQFDFQPYAPAGRNKVTSAELLVLFITNAGGGAVRYTGLVQRPGSPVAWDGIVAMQDHLVGMETACHELCHLFGAIDLYGPWCTDGDLNLWLSVMSVGLCHPDPWHKLQLGWSRPRIAELTRGSIRTIPAAQLSQGYAPLLLYDPARGVQEFFLLEYRTRTNAIGSVYERALPGNGLVIWHVYQNQDRNVIEYADLVHAGAERGWGECSYCRSLIYWPSGPRPCPSTNTVHKTEPAFCLIRDQPSDAGQHGWRLCAKCSGLFFGPNQTLSHCPAGNQHDGSGSGDFSLTRDVPDVVGKNHWQQCTNCQMLFLEACSMIGSDVAFGFSVCPTGGRHAGDTNRYVLITTAAHPTVMTRSWPDLMLAGHQVWPGGSTTPYLTWYDGSSTGARITVAPFTRGDDFITVSWGAASDVWVDFAFGGEEEGTFLNPFDTLDEGISAVAPYGTVHIKAGSTPAAPHIFKPLTLRGYGGWATIGR